MYIEFRLPHAKAGQVLRIIEYEMQTWSQQYAIAYRKKTIKYTHRITFDQDESYSFWAMTWNPKQHPQLNQYRVVVDLNNKI